jgi:hypothetical protein
MVLRLLLAVGAGGGAGGLSGDEPALGVVEGLTGATPGIRTERATASIVVVVRLTGSDGEGLARAREEVTVARLLILVVSEKVLTLKGSPGELSETVCVWFREARSRRSLERARRAWMGPVAFQRGGPRR